MPIPRLSRLSRSLLCTLALLAAPLTALAGPIVADELIGQAFLKNSGDATELAKLRALTGIGSLVLSSKIDIEKDHAADYATAVGTGWMLSDPSKPGYFALKFGTGSLDVSADTFFFKNTGDLTQLVWTNEQVQFLSGGACAANQNKCSIDRLSHYITSSGLVAPVSTGEKEVLQAGDGGKRNEVPEPGSLALLAMGALAVAGARRRR